MSEDTLDYLIDEFPCFVKDHDFIKIEKKVFENEDKRVFFGVDNELGKIYAVKEFKGDKITGKNLRQFCRLVNTSGSCNSDFVIPLRGFTVTRPYYHLTDFYAYGTLYNLLFNNPDITLSPSHKTAIAMCLAYGMMEVHDQDFIHRNLSSKHIYLNDEKMPVIGGFDLSRINDPQSFNTTKVGEIRYMAPELYNSNRYDEKVDVYSYGMVLYELSEQLIPYANLSDQEIITLQSRIDGKPQFTTKTPEKLSNFITSCWNSNPQHRPTFEVIYNSFASGDVVFPGTEPETVRHLVAKLEKRHRNRKSEEDPEPEYDESDLEKMIRTGSRPNSLRMQKRKENKNRDFYLLPKIHVKSYKINYGIMENPNAPGFTQYFNNLINKIVPSDYEAFFAVCSFYLQMASPQIVYQTLNGILHICENDINFFDILDHEGFMRQPPLISPRCVELVADILTCMVVTSPKHIGPWLEAPLSLFLRVKPGRALAIVERLISAGDGRASLLSVPLQRPQAFLTRSLAPHFVTAIVRAMEYSSDFRMQNLATIGSAFVELTRSDDSEIAYWGFVGLLHSYHQSFVIDYTAAVKHLASPKLAELVVSVVLYAGNPPRSARLFKALFEMAVGGSRNAFLAMIVFVGSSQEHALASLEFPWMERGFPGFDRTFDLLLAVLRYPSMRGAVVSAPGFPGLIKRVTGGSERSQRRLLMVGHCIVRSGVTPELVSALDSVGFFADFFPAALSPASELPLIEVGLQLVDHSAACGFIGSFVSVVQLLYDLIARQSQLTPHAIATLVVLAPYGPCMTEMKARKLVEYYESLKVYPQYAEYAARFLAYAMAHV